MIAVESAPAIVNYDNILKATEVVYDNDSGETPWDNCDGFEHTCTPAHRLDFDPSDMRGNCYCDGHRERVVIQLPKDRDCWEVAKYARAHGASRQVAAELAAANRRHTLDQLVKWYSDGWQWYGVRCSFEILGKEFNDSLWGIDDYNYAEDEVKPEIADNVVSQLEKDGFTVIGRPVPTFEHQTRERRKAIQESFQRNLNSQNWRG
jgi:hypothetical protein